MGTWSSSLYGNDTTSDVKDTYTGFLLDQLSNQEALEKTLEDFEDLIGDEEEPLFWFALAETQWQVGRLTPEVQAKALEWIEKDGGVSLWENSGANSAGWKKTLAKLKEKLESPMRSKKRMERLNQNLWNIGDVYAYRFNKEESKETGRFGKYALLQKTGEGANVYNWMNSEEVARQPILMIIHVFDKLFDEIPTLEDIEGVRLLPGIETVDGDIRINKFMGLMKKGHYPTKHLFYLGNTLVPRNNSRPFENPVYWSRIEGSLNYCFSTFQNREYDEVEEGIYKFKD